MARFVALAVLAVLAFAAPAFSNVDELEDHPIVLAKRRAMQGCIPINGQGKCSLYTQGCCGGESKALCTMSVRCSRPGSPGCEPICKYTSDILNTTANVTFGSGYFGIEAGVKTNPGIVVIQEWWGVNAAIQETATHLATQGYRVLIPDLYQGRVALDVAEARHLSSELNWTVAVDQLTDAVSYLRDTGSPKVGVIGFCMGGGLALCAAQFAGVDAAAPFYGLPNITYCQPDQIDGVPIQYHLGDNDTSFPVARVQPVIDAINASGLVQELDFYLYPETGHGFFNGLGPEGRKLTLAVGRPLPDEDVVTLAFQRVTAFFAKYLKG